MHPQTQESTIRPRVLILDDNEMAGELLAEATRREGMDVRLAQSVSEFRNLFDETCPNAVFLDLFLDGENGLDAMAFLGDRHYQSPVMIVSGQDRRTLLAAQRLGSSRGLNVSGVLQKPIQMEDLQAFLRSVPGKSHALGKADIERALREKRFFPLYQPKVCLRRNQRFVGAELLARARALDDSVIAPIHFISNAEQSGMILPLSLDLFRQGMAQLSSWLESGLAVRLSFNISPLVLTDTSLPDTLKRICAQFGVSPSFVILEITEGNNVSDILLSMDVLTRLRVLGFDLSLDDFGTGFSSLARLLRLPFNEIKIDRSFVQQAVSSREAQAIIQCIVDLGQRLEMDICAEGVETPEALQIVREAGCQYGQGYLFGRPMMAEEFVRSIEEAA